MHDDYDEELYLNNKSKFRKIVMTGISASIAVGVGVGTYALTQTAACGRMSKTLQSSMDNGLLRVVYVYSTDGELVAEYAGKFDVDADEERIVFDDENNQRHMIYYGSGTIVVDEISEEQLMKIIETKEDSSTDGIKVYTYLPQKDNKNL